jgi:hypothetical protein
VFENCQLVVKNVKLLTQTQVLLNFVHVVRDLLTVDSCFSTRWLEHSCKHVNSSGFSSTIVSQNSENLILLDRKCEIINSFKITKLLLKVLDKYCVILIKDGWINLLSILELLVPIRRFSLFETVAVRLLHPISIGHNIVQIQVYPKPKRYTDHQTQP